MKLKKRIAAAAAALMTAIGAMGMCASANTVEYQLRYITNAPSSAQALSFSKTLTVSASKITVNSTSFNVYITSAYAEISGVTIQKPQIITNTANVNSVGKYYLNYIGSSIPKVGTQVKVSGSLSYASVSKSVMANGTITA